MKRTVSVLWICLILLTSISLFSCNGSVRGSNVREQVFFEYFDTVSYLYDYSMDSKDDFERRCSLFKDSLNDYHRLFDIYNEYSDINNLCTLNKNAGGEAVELDARLIDFLVYAKELCAKTQGEINIMMGSVLSLWHDARLTSSADPSKAYLPDAHALKNASEHTSLDLLVIDPDKCTALITDPDASIDVGAIGKGYAAEKAAELLNADGADGYVLDIGGNLKIIGSKPDGSGWITGIKDPENIQSYAHKLTLKNTSCVTSGDYERYFTVNGERYHHIIDKDTLMPAGFFRSVSVITGDSALADMLSTALFCMSYEDGLELLEQFDGVDVIWITPNGEKLLTEGLK